MRSLLLCSRPPWPPSGGDRLRTAALARALAQLGDVAVVATRRPGEDPGGPPAGLPEVARWWLPALDRSGAVRRALQALPGREPLQRALYRAPAAMAATAEAIEVFRPDFVVAHLLRTESWLGPERPPLLLDIQDALSHQYAESQGATGWHRLAFALERPRVERAEAGAADRADLLGFISERDRAAGGGRPDRSVILPAVVPPGLFGPGPEQAEPGVIGFLGNLRTAPNQDMVRHFVARILPLIRSARPDARFRILGAEAPPSLRRLGGRPGVEFVGEVDDPAAALRRCALTVCPQRFGSGVQNKILHSLAVGRPAVLSPAAAAGLHPAVQDGARIARLDRSFAMAVVEVLADDPLRERLGAAGPAFVAQHHHPEALRQALAGAARRLLEG